MYSAIVGRSGDSGRASIDAMRVQPSFAGARSVLDDGRCDAGERFGDRVRGVDDAAR